MKTWSEESLWGNEARSHRLEMSKMYEGKGEEENVDGGL